MNEYGYQVVRGACGPLHMVETYTPLYAGVCVFGNAKDAQAHILKNKRDFPGLTYNPDFQFTAAIVSAYMAENARLFSRIDNHQLYAV